MRNKGGSCILFVHPSQSAAQQPWHGTLPDHCPAGCGIWVSPAVAAYVDNFSGGNGDLAVPDAVEDLLVSPTRIISDRNNARILTNDVLGDGLTKTAHLVSSTANGILNLAEDGSFSYGPNLDFNGSGHIC